MLKFNKCKLNESLLDSWIEANQNVLLIGEKGVGKTHQALEAFKRNNLKFAYFSGSTLDPWIHLLGIPKSKINDKGIETMSFILPENLQDDVEIIMVDEFNRTRPIIRNALLELQQFKSINGRKFPNLRMVWGAINPPKNDDTDSFTYDVEQLDPAQLDRFHIIVEIPNKPDKKYFTSKFGDKGKVLVDWWESQSEESKQILSPRRLDYIGEAFNKKLNIKFLLPISANANELIDNLNMDSEDFRLRKGILDKDKCVLEEVFSDASKFLKFESILHDVKYDEFWIYANKEILVQRMAKDSNFKNNFFKKNKNNPKFVEVLDEFKKEEARILNENKPIFDLTVNQEVDYQSNIIPLTSTNYTGHYDELYSKVFHNFQFIRDSILRPEVYAKKGNILYYINKRGELLTTTGHWTKKDLSLWDYSRWDSNLKISFSETYSTQ